MKTKLRAIDANLNRLREGIRVVEDICRYILNDENAAKELKQLRHQARLEMYRDLIESRDSENDILRPTMAIENDRFGSLKNAAIANFKRSQESARVLEELLKIDDANSAEKFKNIRYSLYTIEKKIAAIILD
ncbi:hypothetical protein FACS189487_07500 [Campylobacterota bacterium]|nr:hypothetical protein FACS189487_07500 [Campylobacterota bacterium]